MDIGSRNGYPSAALSNFAPPDEYQKLLDRAYNALNENQGFRKALEATKGCTLTHSIGKTDKTKTILTQSEFCSRLTKLRDIGKL